MIESFLRNCVLSGLSSHLRISGFLNRSSPRIPQIFINGNEIELNWKKYFFFKIILKKNLQRKKFLKKVWNCPDFDGLPEFFKFVPDFVYLLGFPDFPKFPERSFFRPKIWLDFLKRQILYSSYHCWTLSEDKKLTLYSLFSRNREFNFIIRQLNFQFQNQYSKHETMITITVYHLLIESIDKTSKKLKL